jgi:hypothetical protein
MPTRESSGVELRSAHLDGNRPRTHPKHSGRKATKVRAPSAERDECPKVSDALDSDPLGRPGAQGPASAHPEKGRTTPEPKSPCRLLQLPRPISQQGVRRAPHLRQQVSLEHLALALRGSRVGELAITLTAFDSGRTTTADDRSFRWMN